jgi:hypothetical protein
MYECRSAHPRVMSDCCKFVVKAQYREENGEYLRSYIREFVN